MLMQSRRRWKEGGGKEERRPRDADGASAPGMLRAATAMRSTISAGNGKGDGTAQTVLRSRSRQKSRRDAIQTPLPPGGKQKKKNRSLFFLPRGLHRCVCVRGASVTTEYAAWSCSARPASTALCSNRKDRSGCTITNNPHTIENLGRRKIRTCDTKKKPRQAALEEMSSSFWVYSYVFVVRGRRSGRVKALKIPCGVESTGKSCHHLLPMFS